MTACKYEEVTAMTQEQKRLPCSRLDNHPISSTSIIVEVVDPKPSYIEPNYIRLSFKKY